jgi:glycosyltransferase involved in cell wall biosynthesis
VRQETAGFEVIVVDNAPDGDLPERLNAFRGGEVEIRYVPEPSIGMHNARHCGAKAAVSDLLLYVDDDAICASTWVQAYASAFADHPEMDAAGGPIAPRWDTDPEPWLVRLAPQDGGFVPWSLLDRGDEFLLAPDGVFFGANMAIRREALFAVGGFNPEGFGATWLGDGETGLLHKLRARQSLIGWVPEASVEHRISEERMSVEFLRRRASNQGAADAYTRYHPDIPSRARLLKHALWHVWCAIRLSLHVRRASDPGPPSPDRARDVMAISSGLSYARYTLRLTYSPRLRALVRRTDWIRPGHSAESIP